MRLMPCLLCLLALPGPVRAQADAPCASGAVYEDRDGDGTRDAGERGLPGVRVSDGRDVVSTGARGRFRFGADVDGRTVFVIKPPGLAFARRPDGLPDAWRNPRAAPGPALKYGGAPVSAACPDFALRRQAAPARGADGLRVLVFADPQVKSKTDVGYYARDIVETVLRGDGSGTRGPGVAADLGLSLGDIVDDDLSLYPDINRETARLGTPWIHVAGNHDIDADAARDEDSLLTFRHAYGPDTLAWEEEEASFVALDDVIHRPGGTPAYIGGLREEQFAFLERYLRGARKDRLLVLAVHIPLFEPEGRDTFRDADRTRLFALLKAFPRVLVLSAHNHTQRHVFHNAASGWQGAAPLHEYNVGAACGAFWSGARDAAGIPDSRMADGTPNGYATLDVARDGAYRLAWRVARGPDDEAIGLHAPAVLRRGAYPAFGVYANVYMGRDDTRVEYRVDAGDWKPMRRTPQPDPGLLAENVRDSEAATLRGYDRSPEAVPSPYLWRGTLPTDLAAGEHRVEVRAFDAWRGELRADTRYRLEDAAP